MDQLSEKDGIHRGNRVVESVIGGVIFSYCVASPHNHYLVFCFFLSAVYFICSQGYDTNNHCR